MNRMKKALALAIIVLMLHSQLPPCAAAQSDTPADPSEITTENEPRIVSSQEVSFGQQKPGVSKGVWVGIGATLAAGLILLLAGGAGGGGDDGGGGASAGQVSFNW